MAAEPDYEQIVADRAEARSRTIQQHEDRHENWLHGETGAQTSMWAAGAA